MLVLLYISFIIIALSCGPDGYPAIFFTLWVGFLICILYALANQQRRKRPTK